MTPRTLNTTRNRATRRLLAVASLALGSSVLVAAPSTWIRSGAGEGTGPDVDRVLGPSACAECHVEEFETWQASAHQTGSKMLTRNKDAQKIARALGIRRLKNEERCTSCHYTVAPEDDGAHKAVAGVSCESCHGGARDWIEVHADFGGDDTTAATESEEHRGQRYAACDDAGMIRPHETHLVAEQCFVCHTVADQELVEAGHPTGAGFELVGWSQGEVRHNFVRGDGSTNVVASLEHRRLLFIIGQMLELKHAVVALSEATGPGVYADGMTQRAETAAEQLARITELASVMEIDVVLEAFQKTTLSPGMDVSEIVAKVADCAEKLQRGAAREWPAELDAIVPKEDAFVGAPGR